MNQFWLNKVLGQDIFWSKILPLTNYTLINFRFMLIMRCCNLVSKEILKLAVGNFNLCQSIHNQELKQLERWIVENRLDKLKFARHGLYQKINKFKTPWVPMDTWIPTSTRIVGTHEVRLTLHSAWVVDQIKYIVHNYSTKLTLQLLSCWKPLLFQCTFSLLNCCLRWNLLSISLQKKSLTFSFVTRDKPFWTFHFLTRDAGVL